MVFYSEKNNLKLTKAQDIKIVTKPSLITQSVRKKENEFKYNKDADMLICPTRNLTIRKARQGKKIDKNP